MWLERGQGQGGLCGGAPSREPEEEDYKHFWVHPRPSVLTPGPGGHHLKARKEVTFYNARTLQLTSGARVQPSTLGASAWAGF